MKPASRPQYYRIKRIVDMVREGSEGGYLPNRGDFRRELEVSPRTLARDLDFLRDEERAPIEYDAQAHGYRLTDESYRLPPVRISRKEAFGFALARKLLVQQCGGKPCLPGLGGRVRRIRGTTGMGISPGSLHPTHHACEHDHPFAVDPSGGAGLPQSSRGGAASGIGIIRHPLEFLNRNPHIERQTP